MSSLVRMSFRRLLSVKSIPLPLLWSDGPPSPSEVKEIERRQYLLSRRNPQRRADVQSKTLPPSLEQTLYTIL